MKRYSRGRQSFQTRIQRVVFQKFMPKPTSTQRHWSLGFWAGVCCRKNSFAGSENCSAAERSIPLGETARVWVDPSEPPDDVRIINNIMFHLYVPENRPKVDNVVPARDRPLRVRYGAARR